MNSNPVKYYIERTQIVLQKLEESILVGMLLLIIGIAVIQIVLRNLFEGGLVWGDMLVRIMVLWLGLVGAMVASRKGHHIKIDVVTRYLPNRVKDIINCIVEFFSAAVCSCMAYYSFQFIRMEFEDGGAVIGQIPAWACEAIIPVAFTVIALRYIIISSISFTKIIKPSS